jgi:hypothetical protein
VVVAQNAEYDLDHFLGGFFQQPGISQSCLPQPPVERIPEYPCQAPLMMVEGPFAGQPFHVVQHTYPTLKIAEDVVRQF